MMNRISASMPRSTRRAFVLNPTLQLAAAVDVSRRGVGRRRLELTDGRALRYLLSTVARDGGRPRLDRGVRRQLLTAGILVRPAQVPRDVHLDPRLDLVSPPRRVTPLRLNPRCRLHRGPALPRDLVRCGEVSEPFLADEDILWVPRPGSRIAVPYTLAPRLAPVVRDLLRRRRAPASLAPGVAAALLSIGALAPAPRRPDDWARRVRDWRVELRARGFAVLRELFEPVFLDAVRAYYRRLEVEGYLLSGDPRRRGAPLLYDEPLLGFLGHQLAPVVRRLTGDRAQSSFTYLRVYDPGAVLGRHHDRSACRWNIDLVVGGDPAPSRRTAWPLWIEGRRGAEAIRLGLGDGMLYRGDRLPHWRHAQRRRHTTVLASLHFGAPATR
jgi:hypothetical protein